MTEVEGLAALKLIERGYVDGPDEKDALHEKADEVLLKVLEEAGYKLVAREWRRLRAEFGFWYS